MKQLWDESNSEARCPYVSYDGNCCRCKAVDSETVCDTASLQLWCLAGRARYQLCLFYPKEFPDGELFWSSGPLRYTRNFNCADGSYSGYKLNVMVDPGIVEYYRALVPKYVGLNGTRYPAHISVVRRETPKNPEFWGKYEGEEVKFAYSNAVHNGKIYFWLNAFSERLEEIRLELGLPVSTEYTRPPDGYTKCFHITLGNLKDLA